MYYYFANILFRLSQIISYNVFEKKSNHKLSSNMFKFFSDIITATSCLKNNVFQGLII